MGAPPTNALDTAPLCIGADVYAPYCKTKLPWGLPLAIGQQTKRDNNVLSRLSHINNSECEWCG